MDQGTWIKFPKTFWVVALLLVLLLSQLPERVMGFSVENGLLGLTALILLAYTIETQGMRRQMVLQNEIAIQPLVLSDIGYRPRELGDKPFDLQVILRNIGRGPALFVQPKDIERGEEEGVRYVARFAKVDYIEAGGERVTTVTLYAVKEGEERSKGDFVDHLEPRYSNHTYDVTIAYEDINGQRRESVVRMGKGGIRLLHHGKV